MIAMFLCCRAYNVNTYAIPSASMEPGLQIGDRIEVDPDAYGNQRTSVRGCRRI